MALPFSLRALR